MVDAQQSHTISVVEAARILGIGRATAYQLCRKGMLPGALRLGRRILVSRQALLKYLEAGIQNEEGNHGD